MNQIEPTTMEMMGGLIREARHYRQQSIEACCQALGISPDSFRDLEEGKRAISLPDLEVVAMFLNLPVAYFWGGANLEKENLIDFVGYLVLRNAIIGTTLRQFRNEEQMTIKALAELADLSSEELVGFEAGEVVAYDKLVKILGVLNRSHQDLIGNSHGPLVQHENRLAFEEGSKKLSTEMKMFIIEDINQGYLETAIRLSKLDGENLRKIAEGILEITY